MCLAALLCGQFCRFANGGAKISIKSYFMRSLFSLSVFSSSEVLGKVTSIGSKLPTAAYWSWEEKRGNCEATLLYVESDFGTKDIGSISAALSCLIYPPREERLDA